ncbi:MAG: C39 family peptidase [Anaerolineae bacterium]
MRILVTPERLEELAGQFQQASGGLMEVGHRCQGALASLDWEARQKAGVEGEVQAALRQARALAEQVEALARLLQDAARRFAEADRPGLSVSGAVLGASAPPPFWRLPEVRLGGLPFLPVPRVVLPAAGAALGGLIASPLLQVPSDWLERVWNWLHGYGWKTNAELTPSPQASTEKGKLYKTIMQGFERVEKSRPVGAPPAQPAQEKTTPPSQAPAYGHDVPLISQQGLEYNGQKTEYGCTAAATAMVLEYWHRRDPSRGSMSAQEILDANIRQGKFDPTGGLSAAEVHDEVLARGYSVVEDRTNATFEDLRRDVEQGPVIAIVKLGIGRTGPNHAVVVTGISEDGQRVRINDPWDGQSHEYPVETFMVSWGADFGQNAPRNNYMVIRP